MGVSVYVCLRVNIDAYLMFLLMAVKMWCTLLNALDVDQKTKVVNHTHAPPRPARTHTSMQMQTHTKHWCECQPKGVYVTKSALWVSSKTAGSLHQLGSANKINIHCVKSVTMHDAVIEMRGLLWLTQMDRKMRQNRWHMPQHHFEPIVLIILASVASNGGRPNSPSFWETE